MLLSTEDRISPFGPAAEGKGRKMTFASGSEMSFAAWPNDAGIVQARVELLIRRRSFKVTPPSLP